MFKYLTICLTVLFLIVTISSSEAALTLKEVRTASNDVLVAFFVSDTTDVGEVDIQNISEWKINGQSPANIFRYATQADACDHHIYLQTHRAAFRKQTTGITGGNVLLPVPFGAS